MGTVTPLREIERLRQRQQGREGSPLAAALKANPITAADFADRARTYRARAEELRACAEEVILFETQLTLVSLAESYERMAGRLEDMA